MIGHHQVDGLVLAAGLSRRMGQTNKLLMEFDDGTPLIVRNVQAFAERCATVTVVLGFEADAVRRAIEAGVSANSTTLEFVINADFTIGQRSSIRAGFEAVALRWREAYPQPEGERDVHAQRREDMNAPDSRRAPGSELTPVGLFAAPGDRPQPVFDALEEALGGEDGHLAHSHVIAPFNGETPGHPIYLPRTVALKITDDAKLTPRAYMAAHPNEVKALQVTNAAYFADVDMPGDAVRFGLRAPTSAG